MSAMTTTAWCNTEDRVLHLSTCIGKYKLTDMGNQIVPSTYQTEYIYMSIKYVKRCIENACQILCKHGKDEVRVKAYIYPVIGVE